MRVGVGTDEDLPVVSGIADSLRELGHEVIEVATRAWPDVGREIGEQVARGVVDRGIVCCWTGTGVSIAANKVAGVRAALCVDAQSAQGARRWNDANVLAISLRLASLPVAREIVEAFMNTSFDQAERSAIEKVEGR